MANYPKPSKGTRHNANSGFQSGVRRQLREDRQFQAKVRQDLYSALTIEQRVAKLGTAPAVKERAKLAKQLAARNAPKPVVKAKKAA